jgi:hypothetical protein
MRSEVFQCHEYDIDTGTRIFSCRGWRLYSHHTHTVWTERPKKDVNEENQAWHRGALSPGPLLTRGYRRRWCWNPVFGTRRMAILGIWDRFDVVTSEKSKAKLKFSLNLNFLFSLLQLISNFFSDHILYIWLLSGSIDLLNFRFWKKFRVQKSENFR